MKPDVLIQKLEEIAPPELAEDYDTERIGLVLDLFPDACEDRDFNISKIAVCLDVTEKVLEEAAAFGADVLICHHNPLFHPASRIGHSLARRLKIAFENDMSIYCMHTNYDRAVGGINDGLAAVLGLTEIERGPMGLCGTIPPMKAEDFAAHVSRKLDTGLTYVGTGTVSKVMICGGSGFNRDFLRTAKAFGADAFVSSELKHSDVLRERDGMVLVDAGHYPTENPGMKKLAEDLSAIFKEEEIRFFEDDVFIRSVDKPDAENRYKKCRDLWKYLPDISCCFVFFFCIPTRRDLSDRFFRKDPV